ncbi:MAG: dihydropteroate synthase [Planctomycetota bacterium]
MFTVIAERINMTRKKIREQVWQRNRDFVADEVRKQTQVGATHIDVNAGGDPSRELDDMSWLVEVVSAATDLPLSLDSADPAVLRAGLKLCNREGTIINSITGEKERIDAILPLVREYRTRVVALTMDDSGMPEDLDGRLRITADLVETCARAGVGVDRIHFDHLIRPASTNPGQAALVLEAIRETKRRFPEAHFAMGLSNVSFGIPKRNNLNKAFFAMLVGAGADGAIIDPTEPGMMAALYSARAVMGLDEYCMEYLTAHREGKLEA